MTYVSLKDVAARAGVSFQTASKVLNGRTDVVAAATRERILAAARDLGYVPNALARGLVRRSSFTIGILADDFLDMALWQFVVAAQQAAELQGHAALIVSTQQDEDPAISLQKLREHRVDGVLVVTPSLEDDGRLGEALRGSLPAVSLNRIAGGGVPLVGSDHAATGTLAAEHLLRLGHRDVGTITGPRERLVVQSRLKGFRGALRKTGAHLPARRIVEADWTSAGGYEAVGRLLDAAPEITGVHVHNDVMALGVIRALNDRGFSLPEDCSIVSCDDLPTASYLVPPLTTVRVPFQETGARAAVLLLDQIGGATIPRRELLPVRLVERGSAVEAPQAKRRRARKTTTGPMSADKGR